MTIHTSVTKVAVCVLLHLSVLKMKLGIFAHATGYFSVRILSESCNTGSLRKASLSVETGISKL